MTEAKFLKQIQRRLAQISIGHSALRNQGAPGLIAIARDHFEHSIKLVDFFDNLANENKFYKYLDKHTQLLLDKFPEKGKSWGASRKACNLFFREIVYNKFIADHYQLPSDFNKFNSIIRNLEVPLDKDVANGINNNTKNPLPRWTSIRSLKPDISENYQIEAKIIADQRQIARVHLDLDFWRPQE